MINTEENPIQILRTMKGAPLSVYFAIYFAGQPVSLKWIEVITGYSDKPVAKAIKYLIELQYINKNNRGFIIKTNKQLTLGNNVFEIKNIKYFLLKKFGVGDPVLSELAFDPELSEDYIKKHIAQAERKNTSIPLLIHKLRNKDQIEKYNDPEDYRKYIKGEYGEFGSH